MPSRRLLAPLALAVALVFSLVACSNPKEELAEHRKKGESYLAQKKWPEAAIEFKSMLKIDPNSAAAHYGLAKAMLGKKDVSQAYWELKETVRLDPKNVDARLQYGQFLLLGKKDQFKEAVKDADAILKIDPKRWEAYLLKARALDGLGQKDEAGEALKTATTVAPKQPIPLLLYAEFLRSKGEKAEAEQHFQKLVKISPGFASYAALGSFLASLGDRDADAEAAYRKAVELAKPKDLTRAYAMLSSFLISRNRNADAEALLKSAIVKHPHDIALIYTLARFYHAQGEREKAEQTIQSATKAKPNDPSTYLLLSSYRGQIGDMEGALSAAEQAVKVAPDDRMAKLREAEVLVDLGYRNHQEDRIAKGKAIVAAVLASAPADPQALFVKAKIDMAENKQDDAVTELHRVIDKRPDWAQAHFLLGSALFLKGDRVGARTELSRALQLDANLLEAEKTLARVNASLGDNDLAVQVGQKALKQDPDDSSLRVLVAQSLVRERKLDAAQAELEKIPEKKRNAEAWYALGRVHVLKRDAAGARKAFEHAVALSPDRYEILRSLLDLDLREKRLPDSVARIDAALKDHPQDARLHVLRGEVSLFSGHPKDADTSFRKAIELDPNDLRAYQDLARLQAMSGHPDQVLKTYQDALRANPKSAPLNVVLGSLYELQGRNQDAIARYQQAIKLDPDLAVAKNNLAYLLAETGGDLDKALDLAQAAKAALPDNPNTADTLGWILYKKHIPSAAVDYLKEAVSKMPPDDPLISLVRHHLALAYEANHQPAEARKTWEQALKDIEATRARTGSKQDPPWAPQIRKGLASLKTKSAS